ncbi:regulator of Sig8 [Mycobacterium sp. 852002-51163_SCH5372311]|uniref:sensor histidine kinase n=1 Tax=Mycobacterium sp. 852002-51163_SCH5372311 TaxID=1834097 RepID=UPI0007FEEB60|nr:sensor histidine kinase [Mycobacterium sp. 852002-51163_SCH5372311]OBF81149.1 regulator of Sig8 [Mycobacterium sp. 852002-51163_SCH5372311]
MTLTIECTETTQRNFVHSALLYRSRREYVDFVVGFVVDGLRAGEPVLVAVPGDELALLAGWLWRTCDGLPADLRLVDINEVARNPSRLLTLASSFAEEYPDRRVRVVSEVVWPGRSVDERLACAQHEALINVDLSGDLITQLCLYDASGLDADVLADACATHPMLWRGGSAHPSADYAPHQVVARCNQPLPSNPGAVTYMVRDSADLRPARSFAVDYADWVGLSRGGTEDLQLIATELATNSLMYTPGACRLAFWRHGNHLVCEARDNGRFDDPLTGRRPPGAEGVASRGLFLVNAIADLVRTHTTADGTTIQAYLRFEPSPGPVG